MLVWLLVIVGRYKLWWWCCSGSLFCCFDMLLWRIFFFGVCIWLLRILGFCGGCIWRCWCCLCWRCILIVICGSFVNMRVLWCIMFLWISFRMGLWWWMLRWFRCCRLLFVWRICLCMCIVWMVFMWWVLWLCVFVNFRVGVCLFLWWNFVSLRKMGRFCVRSCSLWSFFVGRLRCCLLFLIGCGRVFVLLSIWVFGCVCCLRKMEFMFLFMLVWRIFFLVWWVDFGIILVGWIILWIFML